MTKKYPSQEMDRFNVRMPVGMRDEITKIAEKNGRSMNTEIVMMLQDAIDKATPSDESSDLNFNKKKIINFKAQENPDKFFQIELSLDEIEDAYKTAVYTNILQEILNKRDNPEFDELRGILFEQLEIKLNEKKKNNKKAP
ncbi:Arc family DNA-binding protein [Xenorhabdus szentirmaii]|uniref:Arc family DNA-binding protein n=1 Tax=Xenorhabdus szentirmaii TaxID=290112 RepID=UPI0019B0FFE8|nr:Arc family DNA-binding protein [Xenorhabdus sp. 5]MBD2826694.1 Arc family DNA-binding protein [Xenorhabdus sp. 5]